MERYAESCMSYRGRTITAGDTVDTVERNDRAVLFLILIFEDPVHGIFCRQPE